MEEAIPRIRNSAPAPARRRRPPARARHWFNLGVSLYSSRRHLGEALEAFRKALSINNYMASAHYSLGVALVESGDRAEAKGHYEQAVRIEPHTMVSAAATREHGRAVHA